MPRFLVFVPANEQSEAGQLPPTEALNEMQKFNERLADSGTLLDANGLAPTSKGARVRYDAPGKTTVIDGPFTEAKELVAGYWMLDAKSLDEAVKIIREAPLGGGVEVQIRPVVEIEDFGDNATPEIRERQERIKRKIGQK
jgi:hypothetical protein